MCSISSLTILGYLLPVIKSVEKDKNQSKIKLIRIDGNTGRMKNNDRSKKLRFESTYADVVRDGFK